MNQIAPLMDFVIERFFKKKEKGKERENIRKWNPILGHLYIRNYSFQIWEVELDLRMMQIVILNIENWKYERHTLLSAIQISFL